VKVGTPAMLISRTSVTRGRADGAAVANRRIPSLDASIKSHERAHVASSTISEPLSPGSDNVTMRALNAGYHGIT
jgi:hypothetical protein